MDRICLLKNTVLNYDWGSFTAIAGLLGEKTPSAKPMAEMWMGAHPKAPSAVFFQNQWVSLSDLIQTYPKDILGHTIAGRFRELPYLFKVLAADKPLSIQAHPNEMAARKGFIRENVLNIPLDAYNRNYKDSHHKPECICAITPFWVLNGFRHRTEIVKNLEKFLPDVLHNLRHCLSVGDGNEGLRQFFKKLLSLGPEEKEFCLNRTVEKATENPKDPLSFWIRRLNDVYPGDIGVLSPVFLNLVCLNPGQGMYLPPGELHAYLEGVGVELMANSDNVLRGGLTPKYVDADELTAVLSFEERGIEILFPIKLRPTEFQYETPAVEFALSKIMVEEGRVHAAVKERSVEILLCVDGDAVISNRDDFIRTVRGTSVIVPAAASAYDIKGTATFFKASVPLKL
jgi:mannose-6-phosphate isomerase